MLSNCMYWLDPPVVAILVAARSSMSTLLPVIDPVVVSAWVSEVTPAGTETPRSPLKYQVVLSFRLPV
jgi:hypothetical protein